MVCLYSLWLLFTYRNRFSYIHQKQQLVKREMSDYKLLFFIVVKEPLRLKKAGCRRATRNFLGQGSIFGIRAKQSGTKQERKAPPEKISVFSPGYS